MARIPIAEKLSSAEYQTLLTVYANHNSSLPFEERDRFSMAHVASVVSIGDGSVDVMYETGERFRYFEDGTWQ